MCDNQLMQKAQISEDRMLAYYGGMALSAIGLLVVISSFLSVFSSRRTPVEIWASPGAGQSFVESHRDMLGIPREAVSQRPPDPSQVIVPAVVGMVLMGIGGSLMSVGSQGLAGSGLILDPERAREDLKPWSHMAGGMLDDALSQSERASQTLDGKSKEIIKVRCPTCRALNDEAAKFCGECGAKL